MAKVTRLRFHYFQVGKLDSRDASLGRMATPRSISLAALPSVWLMKIVLIASVAR